MPRSTFRTIGPPLVGVALVLLLTLPTAPLGGPGALGRPGTPMTTAPVGGIVVAPGYAPAKGVELLGPVPSTVPIQVLVGLASQDPAGFAARTALESTPGSPQFHQYLTPGEIALRYGAAPEAIAAAQAYFASEQLRTSVSPDGLLVSVRGSAGAVDRAFDTSLDRYRTPSGILFAHPGAATLPRGIPWSGALGLGDTHPVQPAGLRVRAGVAGVPATGCPAKNSSTAFLPCQLAIAYNGTGLPANGSGVRLAVVDPYDSSEPQPTLSSDLNKFVAQTGLTRGNVSFVYPVPTSSNLNTSGSSGWADEEALDLEWARASAPGASLEMVLAPNASVGLYYAVDWLVAHHAADVVSLSWSEPDVGQYNSYSGANPCPDQCNATTDGSYTLLHPVLEAAAAEGIGVFSASDDCGAADGTLGVSTGYPASDAYVTGVGGTDLSVTGSNAWSSEKAWSGNASGATSPGCVNQGGSGGGYAPYPRPAWQAAPGLPSNETRRGVPDISIVGGSYVELVVGGGTTAALGTSEGSPMWAGIEARAVQYAGQPLGSLNPSLYAIARSPEYGAAFRDITLGSNGYPAGPGWDPVTGLGTPIIAALVPLLTPGAFPSDGGRVDLYAVPRLGPAPLTTTFHVVPGNSSGPYPFVDLSFGDGNASLVPASLEINHSYPRPGVYPAAVTVVDGTGNSSTSPPVAVIVGGGHELPVTLSASSPSPALGQSIRLNATAANGTAPYRFSFSFGDGTYDATANGSSVAHAYGAPGGYCAAVVATDAGMPADGGISRSVAIAVGGAAAPYCPNPAPLVANLTSVPGSGDLPGDLALNVRTHGGTPPVSVDYVSDDPYVRACDCGVFRIPGNHTLRAYVNDSFDQGVVATTAVELHPALALRARASTMTGGAPLTVDFTANLSGGYENATPSLSWSFGDGTTLGGSNRSPSHTYATPGVYTAWVVGADIAGGRASEAWLINVTPPGSAELAVGATIAPALESPAGPPVAFAAQAVGGQAPYTYRWSLGANDSAYGANISQSYLATGCLATGRCPLLVRLSVTDATGQLWTTTLRLPNALRLNATGIAFTDSGEIPNGVTPYRVGARAEVTGVQGINVTWSFGNGGAAYGPSAVTTYSCPGNYTVVETVRDPFGDLLVRSHAFSVTGRCYPPLVASVNATPTAGIGPLSVRFNASAAGGVGGPYTVAWNFGDGVFENGSVGIPTLHEYNRSGTFLGNATISDVQGDQLVVPINETVYTLTAVHLTVHASPITLLPTTVVALSVQADVLCTVASVPGCGNGSVGLRIALGPANASYSEAVGLLDGQHPTAGGTYLATLGPFGNESGPLFLWVVADGPNYTGANRTTLLVEGPRVPCAACGAPSLFGLAPGVALDLLLGGSIAAAAAVATLVLFRGRPKSARPLAPPESPEGPGGVTP